MSKKTSVFLARDLSRAEAQRRGVCVDRKKRIDRKAWKPVKLGDVLKVCHGKCQHSVESKAGKYPILATSGEIGRTDQFLYDKPSVLIGRKGTIDKPQYIDTPFWTIDTLFYTKIADGYSPKFMFYLCQMVDWASLNEASGVPSLSANRIEALEVCVPRDFDKQLRIVKSLDAVESHINTLQALISKYEAIKKATVNLLLKPKDDWPVVALGTICEVCSTRRVHESDWTNTGVPFYRARELVALNEGREISPLHISEKLYAECVASSGEIQAGDLLVTGVGSIGVPYLVKRGDRFYFKDGNVIWFKNRGKLHPKYFLHVFKSEYIQDQIEEMSCVGTVGSYTITNGKQTLIPLPPVWEQEQIVTILDSIDKTLKSLKVQLGKSQAIKQGMMKIGRAHV